MKRLLFYFLMCPLLVIAQTNHLVEVGPGMVFVPSELSISTGDTVSWISLGGTHDVNFNINSITGETFGNPEEISSASLPVQTEGLMGFIVFNTSGTFNYDCSVGSHAMAGMVGSVTVSEGADCIDDDQYVESVLGSFSITSCAQVVDYVIQTYGYTNEQACAWDGAPNFDLGGMTVADYCECSCENSSLDVLGCTNSEATNYNADATQDDGSCEFNIASSSSVTTCGGIFVDSGGSTGDYTNSENQTITIYPENIDEYVSLFFSEFQFESCCDYLTIYDGESTSAPELVPGSNGTSLIGQTYYASPTNESGALTITFTSDLSIVNTGWIAEIGCTTYGPCFGFDVDAMTTYESEAGTSDATATVSITLGNEPFDILWSTGETTESISDLSAGTYSVQITDALDCTAESTFEIIVDPLEYLINETDVISSCGGTLYDSGGPDGAYSASENNTITIYPENSYEYVALNFTEYNLESFTSFLYDYITIYDGNNINAPVLVDSAAGTVLLDSVVVASENNETGALTVKFISDFVGQYDGWAAEINCTTYTIYGCMDPSASNYNSMAEEEDSSCYYSPGCTDSNYVEFFTQGFVADYNDGSCQTIYIDDCLDPQAMNFNPTATYNLSDDPCIYNLDDWECEMYYLDNRDGYSYRTISIGGQCWMRENIRYLPDGASSFPIPSGGVVSQLATGFVYTGEEDYAISNNGRYFTWNAAEEAIPYGWHIPTSAEFDSLIYNHDGLSLQLSGSSGFNASLSGGAIVSSGVAQYSDVGINSWFWSATEVDDNNAYALQLQTQSSDVMINSFSKQNAISLRALFGFPEGTVLGCTDEDYIEFNSEANYDDGTCDVLAIDGCIDNGILENALGQINDANGDELPALNYDSTATFDDGSCIPIIEGCMDDSFLEFDSTATVNNGNCITPKVFGCMDATSQNYNLEANVDDGSCIPHILGCMDPNFAEYDESVTYDDGSCETIAIFGCIDSTASNYNDVANVDDGSCIPFIEGCMDANFVEYNALANLDDGSCLTQIVLGCTIDYALNYNPLANTNDGSCQVEGCTNDLYAEFDANANIDDGSCSIIAILGCTDDNYVEYFMPANVDDGSCLNIIVEGCTDSLYLEYFVEANTDDGSCQTLSVIGCTDSNYLEYDPAATVDINTCVTPIIYGCTNDDYIEYDIEANVDDASCSTLVIYGCTDDQFMEFDSNANTDDGSCTFIQLIGCMDPNYTEYNPNANLDDNSCETLVILGCIDVLSFNYNPLANTDDNSCIELIIGCMDPNYTEYNPNANSDDHSLCITPVILGCNDIEAFNYDSEANTNDGSCIYYFAEIQYVGFADGIVEFSPNVIGMGAEYQTYWSFGDGLYSSDHDPVHTYVENGMMEVVLSVNNGQVEIITSIWIEIINAAIGIDELQNSKHIIEVRYFDLLGREILEPNNNHYPIFIEQVSFHDGTHKFYKRFNAN